MSRLQLKKVPRMSSYTLSLHAYHSCKVFGMDTISPTSIRGATIWQRNNSLGASYYSTRDTSTFWN